MMFLSLLLIICLIVIQVNAYSSGLVPLCDATSPLFGCSEFIENSRQRCADTPKPIMAWATKPVDALDTYKLWAGEDEENPDTTYPANRYFTVNLRVLKYRRRYSGILLYAVNEAGDKVGEWETIDPNPLFHGHCPKSILHGGLTPKPYLSRWRLKVPFGTGRIKFLCLLKEGGPNLGEFYYPNKLQLDEAKAAEVDVHQWVGEPGASCTDTCAAKNMLCVPEALSVTNAETFDEQTNSFLSPACRQPYFLRCDQSEAGAVQQPERQCVYRSVSQCGASNAKTPSCDAKPSDTERRVCPCKQDPSKPPLVTPAPPPPPPPNPTPAPGVPLYGATPCKDAPDKLNCGCDIDADCGGGGRRCYVGRCVPGECIYGDVGCPCTPNSKSCAQGLRCDTSGHCVKLYDDLSCKLYPGSLGCPCAEDSGGACNDAAFLCNEAHICISPANVCAPGDVFCQCNNGLCVEGSRCLVHETRDICVPLSDDDKTSAASFASVSLSTSLALLWFSLFQQ